jgi:hypothetical protein
MKQTGLSIPTIRHTREVETDLPEAEFEGLPGMALRAVGRFRVPHKQKLETAGQCQLGDRPRKKFPVPGGHKKFLRYPYD